MRQGSTVRRWTAEEIEAISAIRPYGRDNECRRVAEQIGRAPEAISVKRAELRAAGAWRSWRWLAHDDAELLRLRALGVTHPEIGRRMGRTGESCKRRLAALKRRGRLDQ